MLLWRIIFGVVVARAICLNKNDVHFDNCNMFHETSFDAIVSILFFLFEDQQAEKGSAFIQTLPGGPQQPVADGRRHRQLDHLGRPLPYIDEDGNALPVVYSAPRPIDESRELQAARERVEQASWNRFFNHCSTIPNHMIYLFWLGFVLIAQFGCGGLGISGSEPVVQGLTWTFAVILPVLFAMTTGIQYLTREWVFMTYEDQSQQALIRRQFSNAAFWCEIVLQGAIAYYLLGHPGNIVLRQPFHIDLFNVLNFLPICVGVLYVLVAVWEHIRPTLSDCCSRSQDALGDWFKGCCLAGVLQRKRVVAEANAPPCRTFGMYCGKCLTCCDYMPCRALCCGASGGSAADAEESGDIEDQSRREHLVAPGMTEQAGRPSDAQAKIFVDPTTGQQYVMTPVT